MRKKFLALTLFPCLLSWLVPISASQDIPDAPQEPPLVLAIYDVADLLPSEQPFRFDASAWPGTGLFSKSVIGEGSDAMGVGMLGGGGGGGVFHLPVEALQPQDFGAGLMGGGGMGRGGMGMGGFGIGGRLAHLNTEKQELQMLVEGVVTPMRWESMGGEATIRFFQNQLLVRNTAAGHEELEQVLKMLRTANRSRRLVTVHWVAVRVDEANLPRLLADAAAEDEAAFQNLIDNSAVQAGVGSGFNGQLFFSTSGEHRNLVIGVTPVVGTGGAAAPQERGVGYSPKTVKPIIGWTVQMRPILSPDPAAEGVVQVAACYSSAASDKPKLMDPSFLEQVDPGNLTALEVVGTARGKSGVWSVVGGMSATSEQDQNLVLLVKWTE